MLRLPLHTNSLDRREMPVQTHVKFDSAVAVVTGAGSGIGRSISGALARRGVSVVVTDVEDDSACETVDLITSAGGISFARHLDVTDAAEVDELAQWAFERFGRVDVLCNNAGVTLRPFRAVWDASAHDFEWMMKVNYFGVVNGLRSFLPRMRQQRGHKHVVNTSSATTLKTTTGHGPYTASKCAVDGLSRVLRDELLEQGDDFGVTVFHPGQVLTRVGTSERLRPAEDRDASAAVPPYVRRWPNSMSSPIPPDDVGELVVNAIASNAPHVLTHPLPVEHFDLRLRDYQSFDGTAPPTDGP